MKAYLDNDVVSAIAKDDNASESSALDRLLAAHEARRVELVTSEVTLEEIKAYRGSSRAPVERTFRLLEKVPIVRWDELVGVNSYGDSYTWINTPVIQNDPAYDELLSRGLKVVDARHVFVAAKQSCETFLTCDSGILHRAADIRKLFGMVVQKPSNLVAAQGW
jgi:predicted nucleic acid-binding protein